jgi:enoyl-CoA hydratase
MTSEVLYASESGIATITINRPEARNAVNRAVAEGMAQALQRAESDPDIRVGIVTGAGGQFCAGMDLKAFLKGEVVRVPGWGFAGIAQATLAKPWIAAVEGYALGGGFEIALSCDLIVAADTAKFGLPEVKRGLVANAGGLVRLPRQLPPRLATELVLTGDIVSPDKLAAQGLINRVVASGQALEAALHMARAIAANGPLAIRASKRVMRESADWSSEELFERQSVITAPVFASADAREGSTAFAEKRAPRWRGE